MRHVIFQTMRGSAHLDVGDARQLLVSESAALGGRGQYGQQADTDPRRSGVHVQPERDPRQNDNQPRRNVELDGVETEVTGEPEPYRKARVGTCNKKPSIARSARACLVSIYRDLIDPI